MSTGPQADATPQPGKPASQSRDTLMANMLLWAVLVGVALGVIAMEVGRKIRWDPATETIIGDDNAARLLGHSYRRPWQLPQ